MTDHVCRHGALHPIDVTADEVGTASLIWTDPATPQEVLTLLQDAVSVIPGNMQEGVITTTSTSTFNEEHGNKKVSGK